jgi:hypothetical protein
MCVNIHRSDALAIDFDRQARGLRLGAGGIQQTTTAKGYSARGRASQEIPSGGHWSPPFIVRIALPQAGRLTCRLIRFIGDHIAKLDAEGQSFSERLRPTGRNFKCACFIR